MRSAAILSSVVLAVSILLFASSPALGSPNLLIDDSFESGTNGWIAPKTTTFHTTCDLAFDGECSAVLTASTKGSPDIRHPQIAIQPSADYTFSAYVLMNDPQVQSVELHLLWLDPSGAQTEADRTFTSRLTETSPDWQLLSLEATAPADAAWAQPRISIVFYDPASVYFDAVKLEGPPPLPATDTPPPTETAAPPSQSSPTPVSTISATATAASSASPTPPETPSETPTTGPGSSLTNGGFEEGDSDSPTGWSKYGGDLRRSSAYARSGHYSGAFSSDTASTKWAYQTVLLNGGDAYQFSAYLLLDDPGVSEAYLRISWYASADGSGAALASTDSTTHLTDLDPSFRFLTTDAVVAPETARSARLRVMLAPASDAHATIYVDDAAWGPAAVPTDVPLSSPTAAPTDEPLVSDIGVPMLVQRPKARATVAGESIVRESAVPTSAPTSAAGKAGQLQSIASIGYSSAAPPPTPGSGQHHLLISLASGAVALVLGSSSGLFLARLNHRRL